MPAEEELRLRIDTCPDIASPIPLCRMRSPARAPLPLLKVDRPPLSVPEAPLRNVTPPAWLKLADAPANTADDPAATSSSTEIPFFSEMEPDPVCDVPVVRPTLPEFNPSARPEPRLAEPWGIRSI